MKIRAKFRGREWPYLYDGETQAVSIKFGVVATPHIYIFDQDRKLAYQGRIDDNHREDLVKSHDARNALDALLAGRPVPVTQTGAFGCTTKWMSKASGVEEEWAKIQAEPVTLDLVGVDDLKKLRANGTGKVLLVHFWSTGCATCVSQFPDLETTFRMYRLRSFDFVTVSTDPPGGPGGPGLPQEAVRVEPEQAICRRRRERGADGLGREVEAGIAVHDGDRAGRQRPLSEGRQAGHPGDAASHPGEHAGHQGVLRAAGVLAGGRR